MIRISKNNIVYHPLDIDSKPRFIDDNDLPMFLSDEIKIAKNVTFKRIFDLIILHKKLFNVIFAQGTLGNYLIDDYIDDYNKTTEIDDDFEYLEICWGTEYYDFEDNKNNNDVYIYGDFHGINENYTGEYSKKPCRMSYGLDFRPISSYKNKMLSLNDNLKIDAFKQKQCKIEKILEGKKRFTLFEVIGAILYEITFFGSTKNRDEKKVELINVSERIKSGEEKLYEWKGFNEDGSPNFEEIDNSHLNDGDNCID